MELEPRGQFVGRARGGSGRRLVLRLGDRLVRGDGDFGGHALPSKGSRDAFVAKLNPTATSLLYSTFLGGSDNEGIADIAIDFARNVYVTGQTMSPDFPTTPGAPDRIWNGDPAIFWADAFIAKLTPVDGPGTTPVFGLATITTNASSVTGGGTVTGTVSVNAPAPTAVVVSLASSNPGVVSLPANARGDNAAWTCCTSTSRRS